MKAHEAVSKLFEGALSRWGAYGPVDVREHDGGTKRVFRLHTTKPLRISLVEYPDRGYLRATSILCVWAHEPDDTRDSILTVRGGPSGTGVWQYGRGNQYVTDVRFSFGRALEGSLLDERFVETVWWASDIFTYVRKVIPEYRVEQETYFDGQQGDEP